ncbi:MAG: D-inositol-3-phosphate glycosyltransferase [Steroidobacteraceae bacterium]|nr:D-inositol-3-phosphate glycosyltransferase [Steroidobacteraceae bacterium]
MSPPLVLHVIHHLVIGGLENGLVNLINRMPPSHFRHAVACIEDYSDFRNRLTRPDVEVIALHRSVIGIWELRRQLFKLCRRLRPTIVHSRNISGLDAVLPAFLARVPYYIHGEHGWSTDDLGGRGMKAAFLRRVHSPFVDRYITVSRHIEHYLKARVGIADSRITQIYNGVDTDRFMPALARTRQILPQGFADASMVVIGTVGRIQRIKDQETLIRAFAALSHEPAFANRARLAIVGDGPLLGHLRELVASLGIAPNVWFPGAATNVPDIMRTLDVFVLPSLLEGISNTILEAMATGLPVLATAVGGNPELVQEGRTGRLFQPRDIGTLAKLLGDYVADSTLRQNHARNARAVAVEQFGLNTMVRRYEAVYREAPRR